MCVAEPRIAAEHLVAAFAQEREARKAAEERARQLAGRPPEVPADVIDELNGKDREIEQYRAEVERMSALYGKE